jgi:hypothetical protein
MTKKVKKGSHTPSQTWPRERRIGYATNFYILAALWKASKNCSLFYLITLMSAAGSSGYWRGDADAARRPTSGAKMQAVWTPIAATEILRYARIPVSVSGWGIDRRAGFRLPAVAERRIKDERLDAFSGIPLHFLHFLLLLSSCLKSHSPKFPPFCKFCLKNQRRS